MRIGALLRAQVKEAREQVKTLQEKVVAAEVKVAESAVIKPELERCVAGLDA